MYYSQRNSILQLPDLERSSFGHEEGPAHAPTPKLGRQDSFAFTGSPLSFRNDFVEEGETTKMESYDSITNAQEFQVDEEEEEAKMTASAQKKLF